MPVIAIDGPSGSGKSTLATALSTRLGIARLDTGAMYRAVALAALNAAVDLEDEQALANVACSMQLTMGTVIELDGDDVSAEIRTERVSEAASKIASKPSVRIELVRRQREWVTQHGGGVVEGRDIASVVMPDADVKVFLTADLDERGRRRTAELTAADVVDGTPATEQLAEKKVALSLSERDQRDASREASPLVVAPGAIVIDSTSRSVEDIVNEVVSYL